jgi:hypothetical protein
MEDGWGSGIEGPENRNFDSVLALTSNHVVITLHPLHVLPRLMQLPAPSSPSLPTQYALQY